MVHRHHARRHPRVRVHYAWVLVPAIQAGGWGGYVPHGLVWALEHADPPEGHDRSRELPDRGGLASLVAELA